MMAHLSQSSHLPASVCDEARSNNSQEVVLTDNSPPISAAHGKLRLSTFFFTYINSKSGFDPDVHRYQLLAHSQTGLTPSRTPPPRQPTSQTIPFHRSTFPTERQVLVPSAKAPFLQLQGKGFYNVNLVYCHAKHALCYFQSRDAQLPALSEADISALTSDVKMLRNILNGWHRAEELPKHTPFLLRGILSPTQD